MKLTELLQEAPVSYHVGSYQGDTVYKADTEEGFYQLAVQEMGFDNPNQFVQETGHSIQSMIGTWFAFLGDRVYDVPEDEVKIEKSEMGS